MAEKNHETERKTTALSEEELKKLFSYIESVRFGSITLIVQDGKVVQIEKSEKFKLK